MSPVNGKKRRRDDFGSIELQFKLSSSPVPRHSSRPDQPSALVDVGIRSDVDSARRHILPKSSRLHDSKRQRLLENSHTATDQDNFFARNILDPSLADSLKVQNYDVAVDRFGTKAAAVDLRPCHICHRKPTVRNELDAFANCDGCGLRTCYICIRECLGFVREREGETDIMEEGGDGENCDDALTFSFHRDSEREGLCEGIVAEDPTRRKWLVHESEEGCYEKGETLSLRHVWDAGRTAEHRGMVCSRCCVERDTEGEVWCLGCLRAEEAG